MRRVDRERSATRAQIREIDRVAIEEYGVPGLALMENAGAGAARLFRERFGGSREAVILCGKGNNGGDGSVIVRHLAYAGWEVRIALLCEKEEVMGDAGVNLAIVERMGLSIRVVKDERDFGEILRGTTEETLVVDAILGTGVTGEVRGLARAGIEMVNAGGYRVGSVDIPSGLDADTGEALGCAVRARVTATFGLAKAGFGKAAAGAYTGEVVVIDIGWPANAVWDVIGGGGGRERQKDVPRGAGSRECGKGRGQKAG